MLGLTVFHQPKVKIFNFCCFVLKIVKAVLHNINIIDTRKFSVKKKYKNCREKE